MEAAALGFLIGILGVQGLPVLPAWDGIVLGVAVAGLTAFLCAYRRFPAHVGLRTFGLAGLLGASWGLVFAAWQLQDRLDPLLEGQKLVAVGVVDGLVTERGERSYFPFRVSRLDDEPADLRLRVSGWRLETIPRAGERWQLPLRLRGTRGFRNPGTFDYEGWLFRQGYDGRAFIDRRGRVKRLAPGSGFNLQRWRKEIGEAITGRLEGAPQASLIRALVVGDRQDIGEEQWEVLRRTGTGHLVAISGLHVALLSGLVFWVIGRCWGRLGLRIPAPVVAAAGALIAAVVYAALAGFAVPTQRALVMLAVVLGAVMLRRAIRPGHSLSLALIAVLALDPLAVQAPGFWLSFLAVAAILATLSRGKYGPFWRKWPRLQIGIAVALFPMSLYWFDQASLVAPVVNLLAVPVVGFLVVPLSLMGAALLPMGGVGVYLLQLALWILDGVWQGLSWTSAWPWAQIELANDPLGLLLALLGVGIGLAPRGVVPRWLALPLLLPMLLGVRSAPPEGGMDMAVLDVGQGLAVVVRTHEHVLVYDTGPGFRSGFNTGAAVVAPYLRSRGVHRLDALVVSHGDTDHSGGTRAVVEVLKPERIWLGEDLPGVTGDRCRKGETWTWDGVRFRFLGPRKQRRRSGNNASCVLRIEAGGRAILLPGDIEASMERGLVRASEPLAADLILVPHHGSASSSTPEFVAAVSPEWAIYSAGYRNRFGFPKTPVFERWRDAGARAWITGERGAGRWRIHGDGRLEGPWSWARDGWASNRRYWHSP